MTWKHHVKSLNTLLKIEPQLEAAGDRTLTVYLPIRAEGFDATRYDVTLKHLTDEYVHKLEEKDRAVLESELARFKTHLQLVRPAGISGIAAFSNDAQKLLVLIRLPESVEPRIELGPPLLAPLELMLEHHPPALVVVVDKEEARTFASVLGEVVVLEHVKGQDVRHSRAGGTSAPSNQRRAENRARANMKRVVEILGRETQHGEFTRIYVAGPDEARAELMREMPKQLASAVAGTLSLSRDGTPGKLATEIREAMAHIGVTPAT